jgi:adenylosuccinate lyase
MRKNLDALDGLMLSEAVMFALAERVGRQTAHDVVYECAMRSVEVGAPFRDVLMQHEVVAVHLSSVDIDLLLDPARYLGLATQFVDRTLRATALSRELRN